MPRQSLKPHQYAAARTKTTPSHKLFWPLAKSHDSTKTVIIGTNLLTKFHEDRKINVASRVKNAPTPGSHVFQPTDIIFELVQDIIGINLLTKKNALPLGSHFFQANVTIFKIIQDIIETIF
ncbi:hypothetical protein DPMN_033463 [Dreissena polymorpha]|uniref:Uncharacterized protein n=1 Tax=Dreissena polymorpha TaxID=45954 RepID=A0A9D4M8F6_DREPO|nr:hypothetical protein DPMN_033463 [Dreissena polymorpha]